MARVGAARPNNIIQVTIKRGYIPVRSAATTAKVKGILENRGLNYVEVHWACRDGFNADSVIEALPKASRLARTGRISLQTALGLVLSPTGEYHYDRLLKAVQKARALYDRNTHYLMTTSANGIATTFPVEIRDIPFMDLVAIARSRRYPAMAARQVLADAIGRVSQGYVFCPHFES